MGCLREDGVVRPPGDVMRYEKGHKEASRQRIVEVASERFRRDGIAASGLAGIMSDAGLTNGAFYPHFASKVALVRESVGSALDDQLGWVKSLLEAGGPAAVIDAYLSVEHRDDPATGCASAALLPEIARGANDTRQVYTGYLRRLVEMIAAELPDSVDDREGRSFAVLGMLIGTLEMSRAADEAQLSERILLAGRTAAKTLLGMEQGDFSAKSGSRSRRSSARR